MSNGYATHRVYLGLSLSRDATGNIIHLCISEGWLPQYSIYGVTAKY